MSVIEQFPYCDRNQASEGLDLMPDLPIVLRHQSNSLSGMGLVDSGASISVLPYLRPGSPGLLAGRKVTRSFAPRTSAKSPLAIVRKRPESSCRAGRAKRDPRGLYYDGQWQAGAVPGSRQEGNMSVKCSGRYIP